MKKKILYPIMAILLVLAAMEAAAFVGLKIIGFRGLTQDDSGKAPVAPTVEYNLRDKGLTIPDTELIFRVRPNPGGAPVGGYEMVNSLGFRGREFGEAVGAAVKIMVVGDSNGFGWDLARHEDTWPAQMEHKLAAKGVKARIYNTSQPGHSTYQARILFEKWFDKIKPDFVIFHLGWNDIWSTPGLTDEETIRVLRINANPLVKAAAATNTYTLVGLILREARQDSKSGFAEHAGYGAAGMKTRVPLDESIDNMEAMVQRVIREGGKPIIILPPYAMMADPELKAIDKFNAAVFTRLRGKAMFIQPSPMRGANPQNWRYFTDDGFHANAAGAELLATDLAEAVTGYTMTGWDYVAPDEWIIPAFATPKEIGGEAEDSSSLAGITRIVDDPMSKTGALVFGPYIRHECDKARATFRMKAGALIEGPLATIDVVAEEGRSTLASMTLGGKRFGQAGQWAIFHLEFSTPEPVEKLETRIYFHGGASLSADVIRVQCVKQ